MRPSCCLLLRGWISPAMSPASWAWGWCWRRGTATMIMLADADRRDVLACAMVASGKVLESFVPLHFDRLVTRLWIGRGGWAFSQSFEAWRTWRRGRQLFQEPWVLAPEDSLVLPRFEAPRHTSSLAVFSLAIEPPPYANLLEEPLTSSRGSRADLPLDLSRKFVARLRTREI